MEGNNSYLTNIPANYALEIYISKLDLKPSIEKIPVIESLNRTLAKPAFTKKNSPYNDNCAEEGVMVVSRSTLNASQTNPITLIEGADFRYASMGDPISSPYDAVIPYKDIDTTSDSKVISITQEVPVGQYVNYTGDDIAIGEILIPSKCKIRPLDIGALLSGGLTHVYVNKKPKIAIIPIGNRFVDIGKPVKEGQVIESGSYIIQSMLSSMMVIPLRYKKIKENYSIVKNNLVMALQESDVILICSESHTSSKDSITKVIQELGYAVVKNVNTKPGRAVTLAIIDGKPIISIPLPNISSYLTFKNFALPVINKITEENNLNMSIFKATLTRDIPSSLMCREYIPVKLGKVCDKIVATPLSYGTSASTSLAYSDAILVINYNTDILQAGDQANVVLTQPSLNLDNTLVSLGSHDMILDIVSEMLNTKGVGFSSSNIGSVGGLHALSNKDTHIAPFCTFDEPDSINNAAIINKLFRKNQIVVIKGVIRTIGLIVQKGNPLNIQGIEDLTRCRYVNRKKGSSTRTLLDYHLQKLNIKIQDILGYKRIATNHMKVAVAVASNNADAGIGTQVAAIAQGLDFIPIANENYDFITRTEFLELEFIKEFINVLNSKSFKAEVNKINGYKASECGKVIYI